MSERTLTSPRVKGVVLDAMGVIYETGDDVNDLLIPFARRKGCRLSDAEIDALYAVCILGRISSGEFWLRLGISEDTDVLEEEYLSLHKTNPGLHDFLRRLNALDIQVVCLSNDVAEWSVKLRRMHNLEPHFAAWIISGEAGVRKPDPQIYSLLKGAVTCPLLECVFVDDWVPNLAPARKLGLTPVLFAGSRSRSSGLPADWPTARSFREVERLILGSTT